MSSIDQYFPAMQEAKGRFFYVPRATLSAVVALAVLAGGVAYAMHYPTKRINEATARLNRYDSLITSSTSATASNIAQLTALVAGKDKGIQDEIQRSAGQLQTKLYPIRPITLDEVHTAVQKRNEAYAAAQAVIAKSPFRGTPAGQVPASVEGKAYLAALKVTPAPRLEWDSIDLASDQALGVYKSALDLQAQTASFVHRVDVALNGNKAAPAQAVEEVQAFDMSGVSSELETQAQKARALLPIDTSSSPAQAMASAPAPAPAPVASAVPAQAQAQAPASAPAAAPVAAVAPAPAVVAAPQPAVDQQAQAAKQAEAKARATEKRELAQEQARQRAAAAQQAAFARQQQAAAPRPRPAQSNDGYIEQ